MIFPCLKKKKKLTLAFFSSDTGVKGKSFQSLHDCYLAWRLHRLFMLDNHDCFKVTGVRGSFRLLKVQVGDLKVQVGDTAAHFFFP